MADVYQPAGREESDDQGYSGVMNFLWDGGMLIPNPWSEEDDDKYNRKVKEYLRVLAHNLKIHSNEDCTEWRSVMHI